MPLLNSHWTSIALYFDSFGDLAFFFNFGLYNYIMKKFILLFLGLAVISCGGSDDDDAIDPLIGVWVHTFYSDSTNVIGEDCGDSFTKIMVNSDGSYSVEHNFGKCESELEEGLTWLNNGSDFNSTIQTYTLYNSNDDPYNDDDREGTATIIFSNDFNSFTANEPPDTYIRQ